MQKADLHIHTTASDSIFSPKDVIKWAQIRRLSAIGITDHDTIKGIRPVIEAASDHKLLIVPGIELSSQYEDEEIHLLGYFIDYNDSYLIDKLDEIQNIRQKRAEQIILKLNDIGINITVEQVRALADKGTIGRPHIARAMIQGGYVTSINEAFSKYLGRNCPAYVERYKLSLCDAVNMVKRTGGVPVLAHPGLIRDKSKLVGILNLGIMGIEAYHSKHSYEDVKNTIIIARSRNLIVTGGSDCHGEMINKEPLLGKVTVDFEAVTQLIKNSKKN